MDNSEVDSVHSESPPDDGLLSVSIESEPARFEPANKTEHNANRLIMLDAQRTQEKMILEDKIDEQSRVREELQKNLGEITFQITTQQLNIDEEIYMREACIAMHNQNMEEIAEVRQHIEATNVNFGKCQKFVELYYRLRAPFDRQVVIYTKTEALNQSALNALSATKKKADSKKKAEREELINAMEKQLQKMADGQRECDAQLLSLAQAGSLNGADPAWLDRLGRSNSVIELVTQAEKAVSFFIEKNKKIKKIMREKELMHKSNEKKIEAGIAELTDVEARIALLKADWEHEMNEQAQSNDNYQKVSAEADALTEDINALLLEVNAVEENVSELESHEQELLTAKQQLNIESDTVEAEITLKMEKAKKQQDQVETDLASNESERNIFSGRILEITQQAETMCKETVVLNDQYEALLLEKKALADFSLLSMDAEQAEDKLIRLNDDLANTLSEIEECERWIRELGLDEKMDELGKFIQTNVLVENRVIELRKEVSAAREGKEEMEAQREGVMFAFTQAQRFMNLIEKEKEIEVASAQRYKQIQEKMDQLDASAQEEIERLSERNKDAEILKQEQDEIFVLKEENKQKKQEPIKMIDIELLKIEKDLEQMNTEREYQKQVIAELTQTVRIREEMMRKLQDEEQRKLEESRAQEEEKSKADLARQEQRAKAKQKKDEEKRAEMALLAEQRKDEIKRRKLEAPAKSANSLHDSMDRRWSNLLKENFGKQVKEEKVDDYPAGASSVTQAPPPAQKSDGAGPPQRKFFKSRKSEPVYRQAQTPKARTAIPKGKTVFDYDDDDDDSCQFLCEVKGQASKPQRRDDIAIPNKPVNIKYF